MISHLKRIQEDHRPPVKPPSAVALILGIPLNLRIRQLVLAALRRQRTARIQYFAAIPSMLSHIPRLSPEFRANANLSHSTIWHSHSHSHCMVSAEAPRLTASPELMLQQKQKQKPVSLRRKSHRSHIWAIELHAAS